jgi:hypothetical protein
MVVNFSRAVATVDGIPDHAANGATEHAAKEGGTS